MTGRTNEDLIAEGLTHHRAGRLPAAEAIYDAVLRAAPNHAQALQLLGVIAAQRGDHPRAVDLIRKAVQLDATQPKYFNNLGISCQALGDLPAAELAFNEAIRLNPWFTEAHNNFGLLRKSQGRWADAIECFRRSLQFKADYPDAHSNLGVALKEQGRFDEAAAECRAAVQLCPQSAPMLTNLAAALVELNQFAEAADCCQRAIALQPGLVEAHVSLATALLPLGRLDESVAAAEQALRLKPDSAEARLNLATARKAQGRLDESIALFDQTLAAKPDYSEARFNRALTLLLQGALAAGWPDYEQRWNLPAFRGLKRSFPQPEWDGSSLAGKTILLYAEQGLGDTLQFVRYAPLLAATGATVIVECQPELRDLIGTVKGVSRVLAKGEPPPPFDVHAPLLSLPRLCNTTLDTIPAEVPYLAAPALASDRFSALQATAKFKVGLVWAGNPQHKNDLNRSIPLSRLAPLLAIPNTAFFGLQVGLRSADLAQLTANRPLDLSGSLRSFSDTAAVLNALDLLISVDTSVVHLAGALGRPVWTLLPFVPDWRWLTDREDTPWYPSLRLFRQPAIGDWDSVIRNVGGELKQLAAQQQELV